MWLESTIIQRALDSNQQFNYMAGDKLPATQFNCVNKRTSAPEDYSYNQNNFSIIYTPLPYIQVLKISKKGGGFVDHPLSTFFR